MAILLVSKHFASDKFKIIWLVHFLAFVPSNQIM